MMAAPIIAADMQIEEATNDDATQSTATQEAPPSEPPVTPPEESPPDLDHFAAIAAVMPESEMDNLAARIIASGGTEGVELAVSGMEPEKFAGHVAAIQSELQASADAYVESQGVNVADFYQFVQSRGSRAVTSTALLLYHSRDAGMALDPLIAEYRRSPKGRSR
jgi:hypothetical protein